jgi:hypothetical protein
MGRKGEMEGMGATGKTEVEADGAGRVGQVPD